MSLSYNFLKRIVLTLFFVGIATNAMAKICFLPGLDNCDNGQLRDDPIVSCSSYNGYDEVTDCQKNLPASQICTLNNGCHYRVCQYNSQSACLKNIAENQKCVEDTDTSCYYRVKKTCVEINENYINPSEKKKKGDSYKCSEKAEGEDGKCFLCTKKKCSDYSIPGSIVKDSCDTKIYDVEETDWTDGESTRKCVKCTLKSCTKLTPAHSVKGTCKSNQTETSAGVSGSEGPCVDCVDNSYVITVTDTPTIKQTENYGYNITVKRKVTTTGTKTVNVTSRGTLNGINKIVRNNSTWYISRNNDETGKATSKNDIKWSRMGVTINNITVANVPLTDNNPLKACEPKENIKATDGTYRVICQYGGGIGTPTCEKINSNYKSSGECADGEKVDAGIYDADGNKCFYCKKTEDDNLCFKLVFKCNGETCSDSDLEQIGINNTLTFNNPDSLTPSYSSDQHTGYSGSSTCYRKQDILAMMNNRDESFYAMPYVALKVETNVNDYNINHPNENNYIFKNSDNDNFFTKYVALINNNGTLQYTLINKHDEDQSDDTNSGVGIVPGEYIECYAKMCEDGNTNNCTYDKIYKCYWENKDIKQVTSSPIEIPIELGNFTGAPKCIYFTAKCPHLQNNGGKAENCIDKVTATIIASKSTQDSSRVGTIFEYYPNKIREPQSGYYKVSYKDMSFNEGSTINGNNVTFKICGYDEYTTEEGDPVAANYIQDWDKVNVYVEANRKVDSNGNGGYLYADKNYNDKLYDDSIIKGSNEEYCTKGSSPTWGNLCKDNTYLYELSDIQKSAKFVPILIYNFSIKETSKGSGKDYKLYWTYGITTNKQLKDDITVYQYNAFEQAACTVGAQIYKDSSNHFTTIYKNQSCNYHKTDGNYCTTDKYDIIRINYNPNLDCELHYSYEFRAEIAGRYNLEPGYSLRDGYYYIVTGLSKKTK